MARYDLRLDIPVRAIINANLVSYAERGGTLFEAKKQFFQHDWKEAKEQNLDPYNYTLDDHSLAISLLYCTIVVPRELLDLPANHKIYREFDAKDITTLFDVQAPRGTLPILFCGDIAPYAVCEAVGTAGQPLRAAPTIDTTALVRARSPGASLRPAAYLTTSTGQAAPSLLGYPSMPCAQVIVRRAISSASVRSNARSASLSGSMS